MASVRGGRRVGVRTSSRAPLVEQIVPNSAWTEDSSGHYLLVDLPGFKKEDVKLQVEGSGYIIVRGERQMNPEKCVRFELIFPVPKDSDTDNIAGKFDGEILYVTITKRSAAQENTETEPANMPANGSVRTQEENHDDSQQRYQNRQQDRHMNEETRNEVTPVGGFPAELISKWEKEPTILTSAVKVLRQNKGIVITAVLAFSLGLFVSHKFQSSTEA